MGTLSVLGALLATCSVGPSSTAIRDAVVVAIRRDGVPSGVAGDTFWGEQDVMADVTVIRVGDQQGTGNDMYWPVRVGVRGTHTAKFDKSVGTFDGETEYIVRKNAFGEWVASIRR